MPVKDCQSENKPGYKWGDQGACYVYDPKNKKSKNEAKRKAIIQGIAIGDFEFQGQKVSFDYHETLTTEQGKKYLQKEMEEGNEIYIISASSFIGDLKKFAEKYGIKQDRVFATGSNKNKVEKIKELGIVRHYDNAKQVQDLIKENNINVDLIKL